MQKEGLEPEVDAEMKVFGEIAELLKPLSKLRQLRLLETICTWVKNAPEDKDG